MNKIEAARQEYADWCQAIGIDTIEKLNETLLEGEAIDLINLCEARQERKYAQAADQIFWNRRRCPIVMMSGPSSSGKTSSSLRIAQQARVLGLNPKVIELDNYFVNREDTPLDENGERDYEALDAMDIKFLNEQLEDLLSGKEVELPKFDFVAGERKFTGETMRLERNDILFMEGIHALNPALTPGIPQDKIFRIYISALSSLPGGHKEHNSTTDKRLLRRIVRDNRTRGISPEENILRWPSVRRGEEKYIFPFDQNANVVFNSSTLYDMPLLKYYAEPLLCGISVSSPAYEKAQELLDFMKDILPLRPVEIAAIPPTSIMREFIGGQTL
ncbi:MAG TPA: nucleoside kinase [Candidatus Cryptobacteroides merdipullorum]|uniref:Nucleoside kinase n=1 Tax=Candidatus Cryptobacteroides merdipullorum TaxID=2840771 RepID=A0A9D1GP15_9BACT|nr:nucleoside kinase [Candidatus Cryptobacteroides merdipullorum]